MTLRNLTIIALGATFLIALPKPGAQAGSTGKVLGGLAAGAAAGYIAHKVIKNRNEKRARREYSEPEHARRQQYNGPVFSEATLDIQTRLNALGYDAGEPDGLMGRRTRQAIRQFQIANDQPVTGTLTNPEIALLHRQSNNVFSGLAPNTPDRVAAAGPQGYTPPGIGAESQALPLQPTQRPGYPAAQALDVAAANPAPLPEAVAPYSTFADRPSVLGLTVGSPLHGARDALHRDGFASCEEFDNALFCERPTSFGSDKIALAASGGKIHTITRKLSFDTPVEPEAVYARMPASYSHMIDNPNGTVAASPACAALVSADAGLFDSLVKQSVDGTPFDASTVGFSHACSYYFNLNVPQGATVSEVDLTFFDAAPILANVNGSVLREVSTPGLSGGNGLKF